MRYRIKLFFSKFLHFLELPFINFSFYFYKKHGKKQNILSKEDTVKRIIETKCSVSRFGDGEFKLMFKTGEIRFQKANAKLSEALIDTFKKVNNKNLLICSHEISFNFPKNTIDYKFYKNYYFKTFRKAKKLMDFTNIYGNTNFTRFYHPHGKIGTDFDYLEKYVSSIREIWKNRDVIIVEGNGSKLGIGNDLFENAKRIRRIICPSENAFEKIDDIYDLIVKNANENTLVLLALGPTATVLSARIALNTKIQAIDIGHIDVVYIWMKNRVREVCNIDYKYVNEAKINAPTIHIDFDEEKYNKEIIARIK